jgi:hypothetical protein
MLTTICDYPLDNIYADMLKRSGLRCDSKEEMLGFLSAMMQAHDAVKARMPHDDDSVQGCCPLRPKIMRLLDAGDSIIEVADEFDMPLAEIVRLLANGRPTIMEAWSARTWAFVEDALGEKYREGRSIRWLADELQTTKGKARTIAGWYGQ